MAESNYHYNPSAKVAENLIVHSSVPTFMMVSTELCRFCSETESWMQKLAEQARETAIFILVDVFKNKEAAEIVKGLPNGDMPMIYMFREGKLVRYKSVPSLEKLNNFFSRPDTDHFRFCISARAQDPDSAAPADDEAVLS